MPRFLLWTTRAMATATLAWEQFGGQTSGGEAASPALGITGGRNLTESVDQSLVSRCLGGDEAAWEELVRQHTRQVYGLCFRFTNSTQEAQDLTQEVFLRVFKTIKTFRSAEGSFGTWLARVTRNLLIDHYRRTRQQRVTDSIEDQLPVLEQVGTSGAARPDQALAGREASEILQATLQKLSPDLREAVILRDLQEMEYREIADVLDIPEGTVKSRINRGRAELARLLRKQKLAV
jgi:RNA polymerase sigma-70 factor (ECF subfamily)